MARGRPVKRATEALVRGGAIRAPAWLGPVRSTPPERTRSAPRPGVIKYPEDELRRKFLERYPAARALPVNLNAKTGESAHPVDKFVLAQIKLIQTDQLSEEDAFHHTEQHFALNPKVPESVLSLTDRDDVQKIDGHVTFASLLPCRNLATQSDGGKHQIFSASVEEARRDCELLEKMRCALESN